jgi:hypothetical protein
MNIPWYVPVLAAVIAAVLVLRARYVLTGCVLFRPRRGYR